MPGALTPITRWQIFKNGVIAPGAKLYTYASGTSTPLEVYNHADLASGHEHTNPVVADAEGVLPVIYLLPVAYRFYVTDALGAVIYPAQDNVYDFASLGVGNILGLFNIKDYGAVGDGVTDDTDAIQDAIDAALGTMVGDTAPSGTVWAPNGHYLVSATLDVNDHMGLTIQGLGHNTIFSWNGDATGPMWSLYGSRSTELTNFQMTVESGKSLVNMVVQEQPPLAGTGTSSMNRYNRLLIEGNGDIDVGIYLKGDVTDANNDTTLFDQIVFAGYTFAAIKLQGSNCADIQIRSCMLLGIRVADYGVYSAAGAGGNSAAFAVRDCVINGHMLADIYQHTVSSNGVILDNIYSEASECFFDTAGVTGGYGGIHMSHILFDTVVKSGSLPVIRLGVQGPVTIDNCRFGSDFTKALTVVWQPFPSANQPLIFSITNSVFWTTNTTMASVFPSTLPTTCNGVWAVQNDTGTQVNLSLDQDEPAWAITLKDDFAGTASYTTHIGWWSKRGKLVTFGGEILLSSAGSLSGNLWLTAPVASANTNGTGGGVVTLWADLAGVVHDVTMRIQGSGNQLHFYVNRAADAYVYNDNLMASDLTNTTRLSFTGQYQTT